MSKAEIATIAQSAADKAGLVVMVYRKLLFL
jgi:hypothetical protein